MKRLAFLVAMLAAPARSDPAEYGHMMGYGYGHGFGMIFGPVLWLIVLGLVVAGVIWLVRRLDSDPLHRGGSGALAELDMRFARGEIDADEYAARKKLLSS